MTGASYTRKAVKFDDVISITEQNSRIEQFAKKHKISVTKKYSDRKESLDAEEAFLEMKRDAISRKFDCVFIWSFMYFGKDPLVGYSLLLHTFLPAGIDFAIVKDDFITIGKTKEEIEAYLKTKYKERRVAHCSVASARARKSRANMCYGYKYINGDYVIDEKVRPTLETIFTMALDGKSTKEICEWLNEHQIDPPLRYLKKEAGQDVSGVSETWTVVSIRSILSDTKYKGLRKVTRAGGELFFPIPAYIDEKQYDKLNGNKTILNRSSRRENPLFKKVFDKDTGIRMYAGDYMGNGKRYYFLSNQTEETRQYKKKAIFEDVVLADVEEVIKREHREALNVQKLLSTSDAGKTEYMKRTEEYRKDIENVFEQMLCCADRGDAAELQSFDKRFSEIQKTLNYYRMVYSLENPWIVLFRNVDDKPLCLEKAQKYIDKVLIEKNERVEVFTLQHNFKEYFPKSWTEDILHNG